MPATTTYVLVHGAGLGGWCWSRVRPLMEAAHARVFTPTLSGVGERAHLRQPIPSLETHIADVVGVIEAEELEHIVLVGHSYAGMVITGVADRIGSRIAWLVYLDAAVPGEGDDFASRIPGSSDVDAERRRSVFRAMAPDGVWLPPPPPEVVGVNDPRDMDWVARRATPHPLRTWLDPLRFHTNGHQGIAKTYILATTPPMNIMGYPAHGAVARAGGEWSYREIACGHLTMVAAPQRTAELLLEAGGD